MNKYKTIALTFLVALSLTFGGLTDAQAKRFGGGSSFGSRPSFSQPYQRSATAQPAPSRSAGQQQAAQQNQAAKQGWASRGGLMGMLGGLALGGLLGSLFFGGAFQHLNFLDILLFAGIAFLLYRLFAASRAGSVKQPAYNRNSHDPVEQASAYTPHQEPQTGANGAGFNTDVLFDKNKRSNIGGDADFVNQPAYTEGESLSLPVGFDKEGFLAGANIAFRSLQKAWDDRELADIRSLTTDKVFAEIQDQLKASTEINKTEILKLEAELLEVREVGNEWQAVVLFDAIMREEADAQANQVREVWHFIKAKNSIQPKWYLDGIQQLED
ncbi:MAG: Tim44-like domain-containing protein [Methylococcaceae bacterium]|jgi:predicted lipid-binding transport protein (Tim44 family)